MKFFGEEVCKIIKKKQSWTCHPRTVFFQEYCINIKVSIFYFTESIDRKGRIWEGVKEERNVILENSVECLCTAPGVECLYFRVSYVFSIIINVHHLGVESMYFRVHFVKAKRNPYNFEGIRVFFFYQHYSLPGKSLEIIPFQIPAYIRLTYDILCSLRDDIPYKIQCMLIHCFIKDIPVFGRMRQSWWFSSSL